MDLKQRMNIVQAKINGTVAALTYGYMAHLNDAGFITADIDSDKNAINLINIGNSSCSSEMLRGIVHAFQANYKGKLDVDSTVCDPKYIPWNCVMADKNGYMQRGAAVDTFIDYNYPIKHQDSNNSEYRNYNVLSTNLIQMNSFTDIAKWVSVKENTSDIDGGFLTFNSNDETIYGVLPFSNIIGPQILKDAIQANKVKFITKKYNSEYRNDQFYRYFTFTDSNNVSYIGITNDLLHFTVYNITGAYAFINGVIFMHVPEIDSIVMITRHPNNTIINTIDGTDPENVSDYTKPYYRLIELPFLKKYYKYNRKHVQNVMLGIATCINTETPVIDPLIDNTLIITVFNRIYRIGIPNWASNDITAQNNQRINYTFTTNGNDNDASTRLKKSKVIATCGNSNNIITANCILPGITNTINKVNYNFDTPEYDKVTDTADDIITNMTSYQYNNLTDNVEPDYIVYPMTVYN